LSRWSRRRGRQPTEEKRRGLPAERKEGSGGKEESVREETMTATRERMAG
jgi:hypothetical protein